MKVRSGSPEGDNSLSSDSRVDISVRPSILLVEDDSLISLAYKATLERQGYRVIAERNPEKAIELVRAGPESVDLVLMDLDLGEGMDGAEAATRMLTVNDVPIIFLSSHTESEIVERTGKVGSYGYVDKNSGITVLDVSIRMAFKLFEARRELKRRVAGLGCLHEVAKTLDEAGSSSALALRQVAELLPGFWRQPASACARITVDGVSTRSEGFIDSPWKIATSIAIGGRLVGSVEICYRESVDSLRHDPFSEGERLVLDLIAGRIGSFLERRSNLALLEESERRFRRIAETLTDFAYVTRFDSKRGARTEFGEGCFVVTGYTAEDFAAKPDLWLLLSEDEDRRRLVEAREIVSAGLSAMPLKHRIRHKDGSIRWVLETIVAMRDSDGDLRGYDGIILDITERESEDKTTMSFSAENSESRREEGAPVLHSGDKRY